MRAKRHHPIAQVWVAGLVALSASGCGSTPSSVTIPPVEMFLASGDGQYSTVGQTLSAPLQVFVRGQATQLPQTGSEVLWTIESGDASIAGVPGTVTDSTGSARATIRLGSTLGEVVVRASAWGTGGPRSIFGCSPLIARCWRRFPG